ncbi:MAG: hypothetical protein NWF10_07855 [Candidatus Bathyarchaeota archaeon]|nr:hypothetical protein [Candidatus Bathyarchaeota archaeon]
MKGLIIITFFSIFTIGSLLIPVPMFPGSWLIMLLGQELIMSAALLSALFNGLVYGSILGLLFHVISRKLEQ